MDDTNDPRLPHDVPVPTTSFIPLARPVCFAPGRPPAHPMLLLTVSRSAALGDLGLLIVLALAFEFVVGNLVFLAMGAPIRELFLAGETPVELNHVLVPIMLPLRAAGVIGICLWLARRHGQSFSALGLSWRELWLNLLVGAGTLVATYLLLMAVMVLVAMAFPDVNREMSENIERITDMVPRLSPAGFAGISLLIGLYEEIAFRGFIMPRLRRATGSWIIAVLASTALFTGLHAFEQVGSALIGIGILSIVMSLVTIWRRSTVPAIVAHALFDFAQFLILFYWLLR